MKRPQAKTPAVAIARILTDMGLKRGKGKDFSVLGFKRDGEPFGTMVVPFTRAANDLIDERADEIERLSNEAGFPFLVSTEYGVDGKTWPNLVNFGERVRSERPRVEDKPAPMPTRRAFVSLKESRDATPTLWVEDPKDLRTVATKYFPKRAHVTVAVADEALAATGHRRVDAWFVFPANPDVMIANVVEDKPAQEDPNIVRNVLQAARVAGFVVTHHGGVNGTTQLNHANGNVLFVSFSEGAFVSASGHGWGCAPWTDAPWNTNDPDVFRDCLTVDNESVKGQA